MSKQELESVAQAMVAKGKGILAADESMGTIKRRFDSIKIESNDSNRRAYREMLVLACVSLVVMPILSRRKKWVAAN